MGRQHSQIARHRSARRDLRRRPGRPVLVRVAEPGAVREPERLCIVQERVEDRAGVEYDDLIQVRVRPCERADARGELGVVVRERGRYRGHGLWALFEDQRGAVGGGHGQEKERPRPVCVQDLGLWTRSRYVSRAREQGVMQMRFRCTERGRGRPT